MSASRDNRPLILQNLALWLLQALYTLSPIDLLPDFIPFIGQMDDLLGFVLTVAFTIYTARTLVKEGVLPDKRSSAIDVKYEPIPVDQIKKW